MTISGFVRDDHLHCRTMEEKDGLCFVHECIHAQGSHKCQFYVFFCHDLPDNGMLRSGNFATMAT